ncbi:MAG: hypothetical protein WCJ30_05150 [Deltaproteobacteria bacterium]
MVGFLLLAGCGGRDAQDIAADLEGTVSSSTVDHLLRNIDLQRSPVVVSVDREETQTFGPADQQALEVAVRDAVNESQGDRVQVTQRVLEDTGGETQQLTVTLAVDHQGHTRYVPIAMELLRDGRRMIVTQVRVMASSR